jgi:hypothetical protein
MDFRRNPDELRHDALKISARSGAAGTIFVE